MFHPQGPTFLELAEQALSSTQRGYDLLATKFDYTPFRTPDRWLEPAAAIIRNGEPVELALDICCGTGAAMQMLRPLTRQRVTGLDFSRGMLREAAARLRDAPGTAAVQLVRGDALHMPFHAAYDVAVCFGALGHIRPRDQEQFVAEVFRVLRPGGRFVFATSYRPPVYAPRYLLSRAFNGAMHLRNWLIRPPFVMFYLTFLVTEATQLLRSAGFQVIVHNDVLPDVSREICIVEAIKPP